MQYDLDRLRIPEALRPFAEVHLTTAQPLRRIAEMLTLDGFVDRVPKNELVSSAMELRRAAPDDRLLWEMTEPLLTANLPAWHWVMVNDHPRNAAYARAIAATIRPGMTVLEIGTGSGLLAMMAARAGADHVYTVEVNPVMAQVARECIRTNGLEDRITVLEGTSRKLAVGNGLPRRCDALIHEIMSTNLLAEGVLPAVAHARDALLVPDAPLLPERIWATGVLAADPVAHKHRVASAEGFDISAVALVGPASLASGDGPPQAPLSDPCRLIEFDLAATPGTARGDTSSTLVATASGTAQGVEQWLGFRFPDGTEHESLNPKSSWGRFFHPFGRALGVVPGQHVPLCVDWRADRLGIGLDRR